LIVAVALPASSGP